MAVGKGGSGKELIFTYHLNWTRRQICQSIPSQLVFIYCKTAQETSMSEHV